MQTLNLPVMYSRFMELVIKIKYRVNKSNKILCVNSRWPVKYRFSKNIDSNKFVVGTGSRRQHSWRKNDWKDVQMKRNAGETIR